MDLSIIIVNWNSKDYLRNCIASILAHAVDIEFEIIVIDSASFDGCSEMLSQTYPRVLFIQSESNLGFAKANNEAFKSSSGRILLFLNPDTEVEGSAIQILLQQLETLSNAGIVGAKLLNTDRTIQTSCIQSFPTILNQVLDAEALRRIFPHARLWGNAQLFEHSQIPTKADAVSGACLMIKRSVFEDVGMFSTEYFMYSEDIDLCFKVKASSWKIYYVPDAVIVHHGGASSSLNSNNTFSDVMMLESRWRFFRKTRSHGYGQLYRLAMFSASLIRIGLLSLLLPVFSIRGKAALVLMALKKWTARLQWALGFETWVKKY